MKSFLSFVITLAIAGVANAAVPGPAVVQWTAPTSFTDGTSITGAISYNLYRGAKGAEKLIKSNLTSATYSDPNANIGGMCYYVTAVVASVESAPSGETCINTASAPGNFGVK